MSQPELNRAALRHQRGETSFAEQWHAEVTAVVELLVESGRINPEKWSRELGAEIDRRAAEGAPDTDDNYYKALFGVLEKMLDKEQIARAADVDQREADWREAYLSTPHGRPVVLKDQL